MTVFLNNRYLSEDQALISPQDRAFLFGDGVYEVLQCYDGRPFLLTRHLKRMKESAIALNLPADQIDSFVEITTTLLKENSLLSGQAMVYWQLTRGVAPRSHLFPPPETAPTRYAFAKKLTQNADALEKGVRAITVLDERWARCDIKSTSLLPNTLAKNTAAASGATEAIMIREGFVMEGSHTNIFAVFDNVLTTPPLSNFILGGLTREYLISLAQTEGIPVCERSITESELLLADEVMIVGTTTDVMSVIQINKSQIRSKTANNLAKRLQQKIRTEIRSKHSL